MMCIVHEWQKRVDEYIYTSPFRLWQLGRSRKTRFLCEYFPYGTIIYAMDSTVLTFRYKALKKKKRIVYIVVVSTYIRQGFQMWFVGRNSSNPYSLSIGIRISTNQVTTNFEWCINTKYNIYSKMLKLQSFVYLWKNILLKNNNKTEFKNNVLIFLL